jgi:hypothetical protein
MPTHKVSTSIALRASSWLSCLIMISLSLFWGCLLPLSQDKSASAASNDQQRALVVTTAVQFNSLTPTIINATPAHRKLTSILTNTVSASATPAPTFTKTPTPKGPTPTNTSTISPTSIAVPSVTVLPTATAIVSATNILTVSGVTTGTALAGSTSGGSSDNAIQLKWIDFLIIIPPAVASIIVAWLGYRAKENSKAAGKGDGAVGTTLTALAPIIGVILLIVLLLVVIIPSRIQPAPPAIAINQVTAEQALDNVLARSSNAISQVESKSQALEASFNQLSSEVKHMSQTIEQLRGQVQANTQLSERLAALESSNFGISIRLNDVERQFEQLDSQVKSQIESLPSPLSLLLMLLVPIAIAVIILWEVFMRRIRQMLVNDYWRHFYKAAWGNRLMEQRLDKVAKDVEWISQKLEGQEKQPYTDFPGPQSDSDR